MTSLGSPVSKLVGLGSRTRAQDNQINLDGALKAPVDALKLRRLHVARVEPSESCGTKSLHRVIFAEGHLGATAQDGFPAVLMKKGADMLHIIETTHGWALVAQDFLIVSLHGTYEAAAARRLQLLG
jgi:hypothetical protein